MRAEYDASCPKQRPAIVRRLLTGLKILAKTLLLLPIPCAMIWLNYTTAAEAAWRDLQYERDTALALLGGEALVGVDAMNERLILSLLIENLAEPFDTIALGSSRVMQFTGALAGAGSFYNCGVSGADYRDIMNIFYQFERADKLPKNMILALDPWLLNADPTKLHRESDGELFKEFITLRLGYSTDYAPPAQQEPSLKELLNPAAFRHSLHYALQREEEPTPPPYAQGDLYGQSMQVKQPDGTAIYPQVYREVDQATVDGRAMLEATTFLNMDGFVAPSEELGLLFHRFIRYVQGCGVNVVFLLMPYHPIVYDYATENRNAYPGFFLTEPWFARYARRYDIPMYGSYNPYVTDTQDTEFFDGLHIHGEAIATFFPGMREVSTARRQGEAASPWLRRGPRVRYGTAGRIVAKKYEIAAPELLLPAEDELIGGELCYVLHRYSGSGPGDILLARYAVTRRDGVIYRWDDTAGWTIDKRFGG